MGKKEEPSDSAIMKFVNWLTEIAVDGVGPLSSSTELANEYLLDVSYEDNDERVNSLIRWETSKTFGTGFVTGLGGFTTLPVTIPSALGAAWIVQARLVGAIAKIYGHDLKEDRVKTAIICTLIGSDIAAVLKGVGLKTGELFAKQAIKKIPTAVIREINKKVGARLLTKAGEKGVVNLTKIVPVVGGLIGGTVDAVATRAVGKLAKKSFR